MAFSQLLKLCLQDSLTNLGRIRIRIYSEPVQDPDPNGQENQDPDPDPNKVGSDPQHWVQVPNCFNRMGSTPCPQYFGLSGLNTSLSFFIDFFFAKLGG
jgi:hypothetical protein